MTENTYKTIQVAGTLTIPGLGDDDGWYYLLKPYPIPGDSWVRDDMATFYVVRYHEVPHHIIVRGPFVIDYWNAGNEIEIKMQQLEEEVSNQNIYSEPTWLANVLKGEPASLAEN